MEYPKHHFFWDTKLSEERQREINRWLASLSDTQEKMLSDLLRDVRTEAEYDAHCFSCNCYE